MGHSEQLSVTVAVLTRCRPHMLASVIRSFAGLKRVSSCQVRFLVVENDHTPACRELVDALGSELRMQALNYVHEPQIGIPLARNRAAREAISAGHDLLAFVDDDEVVDENWLINLVEGYRESDAVLLGAPVRTKPGGKDHTWFQRRMHHCIKKRYAKKERRAARLSDGPANDRVTIVTNNWLGKTEIFADHGIWFDENMRFTGGTDAKLFTDVVNAGLPTAWVTDAYVYEDIPPERLTFRYQYCRARDQSNTHYHRKLSQKRLARARLLVSVPTKITVAGILAVLVVPTYGGTLVDLARALGWVSGRIGALRRIESSHYAETTGA